MDGPPVQITQAASTEGPLQGTGGRGRPQGMAGDDGLAVLVTQGDRHRGRPLADTGASC